MKRPREVVVGPFTYSVEWPVWAEEDGEPMSGRAEHSTLTIFVSTGLHVELQRKVLLHEIMHACVFVTGHNSSEVTEEHFIRGTAFALLDVLRDNPEVVRFITSKAKR